VETGRPRGPAADQLIVATLQEDST
jgi:hypothetical protein